MKKYFYQLMILFIIGATMQSCKEDINAPVNETVATQNVNKSASWDQVQQQLNVLDMSYGLTKNIRRSPSIPETIGQIPSDDWDLSSMGVNWTIVVADAIGAINGGRWFWGTGPWGVAAGAVVVGGLHSLQAYLLTNNTQAVINSTNPFVYVPQENRFAIGGAAPIGSEIGELHNCLVKEVLENENITIESLYEYMYTTDFTTLSTHYTTQQISEMQYYMMQYESEVTNFQLEDNIYMLSQEYPDEMNIIKHYAYEVSQALEPYDWLHYTRDYMMVVDNAYQNNLISEESALMINGAISTLYCSKTAWNYIQPDPVFTDKYIIHSNDSWILTNNHEHLMLLLESEHVDFVGYPYIENDTIKRIYVHTESPYNMMFPDSEVLPYLYEDGIFTNTTNAIQYMDNNLTCQPIAIGSYPIHSAVGYDNYVYIDLEQYID